MRGRLVVLRRTEKGVMVPNMGIPSELLARRPEDVGTVVLIGYLSETSDREFIVQGHARPFQGKRWDAQVALPDAREQKVIAVELFEDSGPLASTRFSRTEPSAAVRDRILSLERKP